LKTYFDATDSYPCEENFGQCSGGKVHKDRASTALIQLVITRSIAGICLGHVRCLL